MLVSRVSTDGFLIFNPTTCAFHYPKSSGNFPLRLATSRPLIISWVSFNDEKEAKRGSMRSRQSERRLVSPEWIWVFTDSHGTNGENQKKKQNKTKACTGVTASFRLPSVSLTGSLTGGTLRFEEGDGGENIANSRSFSLHGDYSNPVTFQMYASSPSVELLRIISQFIKRKKLSSSFLYVLNRTRK